MLARTRTILLSAILSAACCAHRAGAFAPPSGDTAQPSPTYTPEQYAAVQGWARLQAILILLLIAIVTVGFAWVLLSRRKEAPLPDRTRRAPEPSAWEEAGKRMQVGAGPASIDDSRIVQVPQSTSADARQNAPGMLVEFSHGAGGAPVALITGAARRVGRATAVELARAGCDIAITYFSNDAEARSLAAEVQALGRRTWVFQCDLAIPDEVERLASSVSQLLPRLDILVHNASVFRPSPLLDFSSEQATDQFRLNALAPLLLSARLKPMLEASPLRGGGSIIALTDMHADARPRANFSAYTMSKAALQSMVFSLARDMAPMVRVNAVAPGVVAWPEEGADSTSEQQARYLRRVPLGRAGEPRDAAIAVRWLALEATYVTGEVIRVDGGRWLA